MYEELIQALRLHCEAGKKIGLSGAIWTLLDDASTALKSMTAQLTTLQAENAAKDRENERLKVELRYKQDECESHYGDYCEAKAELARVEAERDAAIADVPHDCEHCKHATGNGACKLLPDGDQFSPDYTDGFDRDGNCDHWQWRGAQGEG